MRPINEIIIHCSATRPDWLKGKPAAVKVAAIRKWHVEDRGWSDIGYHWVIDRNGEVLPGRPEGKQGAHVRGHNRNTLGVSLIGGFGGSAVDTFDDHFTGAQRLALEKLIADIQKRHKITKLSGHNEYANKGCPCFDVRSEFSLSQKQVKPKPSLYARIGQAWSGIVRRRG